MIHGKGGVCFEDFAFVCIVHARVRKRFKEKGTASINSHF
ncbi:hypothetical protein FORC087_498 (plasmid) [Bacillus cereus]|nr:hypothetical protein FORC087_498 [Bacillus cereus]